MKEQSLARADNKPLTPKDLLEILRPLVGDPKTWEKIKDQPIKVFGDEEGNTYGDLYSVAVSKTGQITLWPGDIKIPV